MSQVVVRIRACATRTLRQSCRRARRRLCATRLVFLRLRSDFRKAVIDLIAVAAQESQGIVALMVAADGIAAPVAPEAIGGKCDVEGLPVYRVTSPIDHALDEPLVSDQMLGTSILVKSEIQDRRTQRTVQNPSPCTEKSEVHVII